MFQLNRSHGCHPSLDDRETSRKAQAKSIPPEGNHNAVIVAVHDAGVHMSPRNGKVRHVLFLVFELDCERTRGPMAGLRFRLYERCSATIREQSTLGGIIAAVFGDQFLGARSICPEAMIGKPCTVSVRHMRRQGITSARIVAVGRHSKGMPVLKVPDEVTIPQWILDFTAQRMDRPETSLRNKPMVLYRQDEDMGTSCAMCGDPDQLDDR
jgi:hypothetical protein